MVPPIIFKLIHQLNSVFLILRKIELNLSY